MKTVLIVATSLLLAACGGGGGSSQSRLPVNTPTPVADDWQNGVFANETVFKDQCAVVRTGVDINGDPYPDEAGSIFEEQMWLRSWSNNTYLWYDEITDQNPANFSTALDYFAVLKTNQTTPSGVAKDNFHFSQPTDEFLSFSQSGTVTGYGIDWAFINNAPPRSLRVSTVQNDSSASDAGVQRGDSLLRINGVDFVNSSQVDVINAALFPSDAGTETEFVFLRNDDSEVTVTLNSGNFATTFVDNVNVFDTPTARVGYVRFDGFQRPAQTPLIESFQSFVDQNVTELVLDLRYNGGGLLAMASQLGYMIAGPNQTNNRAFETQQFNDKHPNIDPVTGNTIQATPFYDREIDFDAGVFTNTTLPNLSLTRVFVITTADSCSASEALINSLRGINVEVVQIGGKTCGKPYGFYPTDNCGNTYFTIQFQGINDQGFGDYADGFKPTEAPQFEDELPGCEASDDFSNPLGAQQERMLGTALYRMSEGVCPEVFTQNALNRNTQKASLDNTAQGALSVFDPRYRSLLLENGINTPIYEASESEAGQ